MASLSGLAASARWARTVLQAVIVLVFALAACVAGSLVMMKVTPGPTQADMSGYTYLQGNLPMLLLALAGVYVVSSFGEEVLYRGFLLNRLAAIGPHGKASWPLAALTSAVIFGLAHFDWGIVGVVQTAFMGLALAIAYLVTKRNLWALVLAHAGMDTMLLVQMYGAPPGSWGEGISTLPGCRRSGGPRPRQGRSGPSSR